MRVEIRTPNLPESVSEATVLAWHKEVGETFRRDESLVDVETEKIVLEVPAPLDGKLVEITRPAGDTVQATDVLGVLETEVDVSEEASEATAEVTPSAAPEAEPKPEPEVASPGLSVASRRLVSEHNLSPSDITGTGKDGRITKGDVLKHLEEKQSKAPAPEPVPMATPPAPGAAKPPAVVKEAVELQPTGARSERRQPMSRIRQTIASRLLQSQQSAALLTTFNEVDLSQVIELRSRHQDGFEAKHGVRLGFMSLFVKAAVASLKDIPAVNAFIDDSDIIYHNYCDVGIAVSSPRGLVVPIVRDAQNKSLADIEKEIRQFAEKANKGALTMEELSGGTFTITNGGVFGSLISTPIVNPPQSAILGMHKIQERPVALNGQVVIRPMMYLALTYDHRIIDGREAVTFLVGIKESLEDPTRLLLEI